MKTTHFIMSCALLLVGGMLFAAEDTTEAELKKTSAAPEIQKELREPDGAAIFLKEDGSFQIIARGTGTYDFDDIDDINDAKDEATLEAKAALAKFMKEKLSTEEGFEKASEKVKKLTSDGKTETAKVTKDEIKRHSKTIKESADAILKGVITLKTEKVPKEGSNSGTYQVTVGVSSKTLKAVDKLVKAIDATAEQGKTKPATVKSGSSSSSGSGKAVDGSSNKYEVREAKTDF